ncbi:ComF family protein [Geodermatophilus sp. SYSU D01105]
MDGGVLAALADLLLPRTCAGCELPGAELCGRCAALLAVPHLAQPRRFPAGFPPTVAAGAYTGPVRPAVNAFKERGRAELAAPLGAALALAVAGVLAGLPVVPAAARLVPVPSSRAALRTRGRDHVRELTRRAVVELRGAGLPAAEARLLRRTGRARDSAGLSAAQRRANLAGTFALRDDVPPLPAGTALVVVDDVVTSGATLTEAAAVLAPTAAPDGPPVLAAVVAATPRRALPTAGERRAGGAGGRLSGPRNGD